MKDLYKIALEEIDTGEAERENVRLFKLELKLESGFNSKDINFFYWLYCKKYGKISLNVFTSQFIGRIVKFDKRILIKKIPNYMELVFEYEKQQFKRKQKNQKKKRSKLIRVSTSTKKEKH